MTIHELLDEYNLTTDDVRWSLCARIAESIRLSLEIDGPEQLVHRLWSGELGDLLYDMEERWIRDSADRLSRRVLDEGHLRDELKQMALDGIRRQER
jgi:hypothetical protein